MRRDLSADGREGLVIIDISDPPNARIVRQVPIDSVGFNGEAHLGLGVALALTAETLSDLAADRGLRLRAIAQFAAVPENDPVYLAALYDRALLLKRVGRESEAREWARQYRERDATSPWAEALDRAMAKDGR
jgi:hypothetical protein